MRSIVPERLSRGAVAAGFVLAGVAVLPFADFQLASHNPWPAFADMGRGLIAPHFGQIEAIGWTVLVTVMFAVAGVAVGASAGFLIAPVYRFGPVRAACILVRSIHELFWALLLMQAFGIGPLTGVLAIALPYTGICAKVFAEYLEEADQRPSRALPNAVGPLARFFYARLPLALPQIKTYVLYRFECGLRSSGVLGFIGLPTLGFQLDAFFREGAYGATSAILILYVAMIASVRVWMRWRLAPLWIAAAVVVLARVPAPPMGEGALWRFLTVDIVPAPLRHGWDFDGLAVWLDRILVGQALPGLSATLVCGQIALVLTGVIALVGCATLVPRVSGRLARSFGHLGLVVLRSIPEYMLAYFFLQGFGPSMLPAVLALGLHNGAIIAHLLGRQGAEMVAHLRPDAPRGATLYGYEIVPRLFGPFVALCLYRWEIILRETAVMGLLGVATLGFYVDAAVSELRIDRVVVLLLAGAILIALVDALSHAIRRRLGAAALASGPASPASARSCAVVERA